MVPGKEITALRSLAAARSPVLTGPFLLLAVVIFAPMALDANDINLGILVALYAIAGAGLSVLTGYSGQTSFGQGVFWAIGAYGFGIMAVRTNLPIWIDMLVAMVGTGLVAW
ncbi:MAG: hypothetical protein ACRDZ5_02480, partial [Acidimicrobiales bacterium]